jgi:TPR repeat protein
MQTLRFLAPVALCLSLSVAGCSRDNAEAAARAAARQPKPPTHMEIAKDAYSKADYPKALDHFLAAAKAGDADAEYYAGAMYSVGDGARKNFPEALKLFQAAAEKNQPDALYALARLHVVGDGVERDPQKALALYERAIAYYAPGEARDRAMEQKVALAAVLEEQRTAAAAEQQGDGQNAQKK